MHKRAHWFHRAPPLPQENVMKVLLVWLSGLASWTCFGDGVTAAEEIKATGRFPCNWDLGSGAANVLGPLR